MRAEADEIDAEAADIHKLRPVLKPGSRILVLRDGLPESAPWSTGFLVHLLTRDPSLAIRRLDTLPTPLKRDELVSFNVVLTLVDGHLRQMPVGEFRSRCLAKPADCTVSSKEY